MEEVLGGFFTGLSVVSAEPPEALRARIEGLVQPLIQQLEKIRKKERDESKTSGRGLLLHGADHHWGMRLFR
eukprot:4048644-Lingulodinium_polyedra.AAC.1